jgi:predicted nucleic-acid-binding protein
MAALHTNILVRYLVQDDERQLALAKKLIASALQAGETLHVSVTVMLELEWVLRVSFGFAKQEIVHTLSSLLASAELSFGSEDALEIALALYAKGAGDFSDCVHVALAHVAGEDPLWTFDRAASKLSGAKLLAST